MRQHNWPNRKQITFGITCHLLDRFSWLELPILSCKIHLNIWLQVLNNYQWKIKSTYYSLYFHMICRLNYNRLLFEIDTELKNKKTKSETDQQSLRVMWDPPKKAYLMPPIFSVFWTNNKNGRNNKIITIIWPFNFATSQKSITIYIQSKYIYIYCGNHFLLTMTKTLFYLEKEKSYCVHTQLKMMFLIKCNLM